MKGCNYVAIARQRVSAAKTVQRATIRRTILALLCSLAVMPLAQADFLTPSSPSSLPPSPQSPDTEQVSDAQTINLVQAYERMLLNDPQVQAARAARDAGRDSGNIARAALLPQASISYLRNRTRLAEKVAVSGADQSVTVKDKFYGQRRGVTIEQTLFDYSAISTYRMGETQAEYADLQYRLQFQQEAVTLIDAYLNALLARDSLQLARYQLRIYQEMLRGNERMMAQGEGTRIDILETRTQIGATEAELVNYENELADRLRELAALLGEPLHEQQLMAINLESKLLPLQSADLKTLQADARQQNPEVQAARLGVRYNDLTIEREKGQFMPRVSAFASYEHIESDNINNKGRNYDSNTIGLQVTVPLFNGGSSYYATRQAVNRREQARFELDHATSNTATMLEKYYRVCATSGRRITTLRQNAADSTQLVQAMRRSVSGGERTNSDALNAERQSYQARMELLRSYVEWFQAYAKLQFYAGRFSEDDVLALNRQLVIATRQAVE